MDRQHRSVALGSELISWGYLAFFSPALHCLLQGHLKRVEAAARGRVVLGKIPATICVNIA